MIEPRRSIKTLTAYSYPEDGRPSSIRLDLNENTVGFPSTFGQAYGQDENTLYNTYPEYDILLQQLAAWWAIPSSSILPTNGSDEALFLIALTFIEPGQDHAVIMHPTFSLIPHYLLMAGATLHEVPYMPNFQYDPVAIESELKRIQPKVAVFATPDNPGGGTLPLEAIASWCADYPETLFVIDEAYVEYTNQSALPLTQQFSNILVTRTFSKAWAMAGLRLGVIVGSSELIGHIKRIRPPYSVNSWAVQTLLRLLPHADEVNHQAQETLARKKRILNEIQKRYYPFIAGEANFFLLGAGLDAQGFCEFFQKKGILLRNQSSRPMLKGMVRVSIGSEKEMQQFLNVLDEVAQARVIIFDMDGTLVDTRHSFDATVAHLLDTYSNQPLQEGELMALRAEGGFNDDWEAAVELLNRRGVQKSYSDIAEEAQIVYARLAPATESWLVEPVVLSAIKRRFRLGVATGRYRGEFDPIWKIRFEPLFEVVICQDDDPLHGKKPSPDILRAALKTMGAEGGLYIGNSVDDMRAALAAGLMPVGVATTHPEETLYAAGAAIVFQTINELKDALLLSDTCFQPNCAQAL